jgi:hypothetical protein
MTDPTLTASRLWKRMTGEQRARATAALWNEPEAATDQMQAVALIGKQMKTRPKTVMGFDKDRKARYLAAVSDMPEALAARLLILYHLAEQRPMMGAFLDALGIGHENGLIQDETVTPDPAKTAGAAAAIAKQYPADDVSLYLHTLLLQDPASWAGLSDVIGERG